MSLSHHVDASGYFLNYTLFANEASFIMRHGVSLRISGESDRGWLLVAIDRLRLLAMDPHHSSTPKSKLIPVAMSPIDRLNTVILDLPTRLAQHPDNQVRALPESARKNNPATNHGCHKRSRLRHRTDTFICRARACMQRASGVWLQVPIPALPRRWHHHHPSSVVTILPHGLFHTCVRHGSLKKSLAAKRAARLFFYGGGKEIRTPDLFIANEPLYQLSYTPTRR